MSTIGIGTTNVIETQQTSIPVKQITTWTPIESGTIKSQIGLEQAIIDFINRTENWKPLPSDLIHGRKKTINFNFRHNPSPLYDEIGTFTVVLSYPPDLANVPSQTATYTGGVSQKASTENITIVNQ